jgi:glycosyltransferase involved in cell wall biosynthesis
MEIAADIVHLHDKAHSAGGIRQHVEHVISAQRDAGMNAAPLRIAAKRGPAREPDVLPRTYWPMDAWRHGTAVIAALKQRQPALVHLHAGFTAMSPSVLSSINSRWPTVVTFHDVAPFCPRGDRRFAGGNALCGLKAGHECFRSGCISHRSPKARLLGRMHEWMRRALLPQWLGGAQLVFPSAYLQKLAVQHGAHAEKCALLPNFVLRAEDALPSPSGPPKILIAGSVTEAKGADLALDALILARDINWTAVFAGQGPMLDNLKKRAAEAGLEPRVRFAGALTPDELRIERAGSAFSLFASRTAESFGMVGIESLASGKPVAGFAKSGAAEWLIGGVTGIVPADESAKGLAQAVRQLALDGPLRARLGGMGRKLVQERFLPDQFIAGISEVYEQARAARPSQKGAAL